MNLFFVKSDDTLGIQGWLNYVDNLRQADPGLSDIGKIQAQKLSQYLEPHLRNQASSPVSFIVSPMKRTIETIMPTLKALDASKSNENHSEDACNVIINGFYFESEVSFAFATISNST